MNQPDHQPDIATILTERLAALTMYELGHLGRPHTPAGKPEAVFDKQAGGFFVYLVRGKHFKPKNASEREEIQRLAKGKPGADRKEEMEALEKKLQRPMILSREKVATNASARVMAQLMQSIRSAEITKLGKERGFPYLPEHAGTYIMSGDTTNPDRPPLRSEVIWDSRGFAAIDVGNHRILPCHLIADGTKWERVVLTDTPVEVAAP